MHRYQNWKPCILVSLLLVAWSCREGRAEDQAPVKELIGIVDHLKDEYKGKDKDPTYPQTVTKIEHDVQKTESLVSPYVGYINYTIGVDVDSKHPHYFDHKIVLVYQGSKWVLKTAHWRNREALIPTSQWRQVDDASLGETKARLGLPKD
jgi:hypothetical protein